MRRERCSRRLVEGNKGKIAKRVIIVISLIVTTLTRSG